MRIGHRHGHALGEQTFLGFILRLCRKNLAKPDRLLVAITFMTMGAGSRAAITPMDQDVPEETTTLIECEYRHARSTPANIAKFVSSKENGVFHYNVFLPAGYHDDDQRRYPCIFVASPAGNAGMDNIAERMKQDRWIVVMLVESKNDAPRWAANFLAAHDDAIVRFRIQEGLKYITGCSGGARCASVDMGLRPGFSGVILQAAGFFIGPSGYILDAVRKDPRIAVYLIVGNQDPNLVELEKLRKTLPARTPFGHETYEGGHGWAPAEQMDRAFDWLEQQRLGKPAPNQPVPKGNSEPKEVKNAPPAAKTIRLHLGR